MCSGNGISVNKTIEMLGNFYGDAMMETTAVYDWYRRFQNGLKDTTGDAPTGRNVIPRCTNQKVGYDLGRVEVSDDALVTHGCMHLYLFSKYLCHPSSI